MMAYERSESARDNFSRFIHQFQPETKTLIRKFERILIKLYGHNVSLLFNQICLYIYIYIYIYIYHHHHVVSLTRISLTLSHHFSLSFIASGRSSGLHPVSSHSCCMYVRAGRPAFARQYVGVHRSTSRK